MWHENKNLICVIYIHVDDFLCSGNKIFFNHITFKLRQTFSFGKEENDCFRYLGLNILTDQQGCINVNQTEYINQLNKINIEPSRKQQRSELITQNEADIMKTKIGQLLWVSNQSRPDISCYVSILASNLKNGKVSDLLTVNKVISKVKNSQYNIKYQPLDYNIKIVLFAGAAFANHDDGGSQSVNLIFLVDKHYNINLVQWQSKRIK